MKQKDNKIQEGASSLFSGSKLGEQDTERVRSQRKFFLTGRRCRVPQDGNKEEIRTSFMLNRKLYDKVREIAMREGITIKDLVYSMLELAIEKYEKAHGEVIIFHENKSKNLFG